MIEVGAVGIVGAVGSAKVTSSAAVSSSCTVTLTVTANSIHEVKKHHRWVGTGHSRTGGADK